MSHTVEGAYFPPKTKHMGSMGDKFVIFNQKLRKDGVFEWQQNFKGFLGQEWAEKQGLKSFT